MSKKFYFISTIVLASIVLLLGGLTIWAFRERSNAQGQLENSSQKAFYDLVADVNNLEVKFNKVNISSSASYQRQQLLEMWRQADNAATNLSSLSTGNDLVQQTTRFVNQTSDYCKYLADRIAETGEPLTSSEKAALKSLYSTNVSLKNELNSYDSETLLSNMSFSTYDENGGNSFMTALNENVDTSIDYPELIYDGPFSDSIQNKTPSLTGKEITLDEAVEYFANLFGLDAGYIDDNGTTESKFKVYNLSYKDEISVQITAVGGKLLLANKSHEVDQQEYDEEACIKIAEKFVKSAGYNNMKKVWISNYNGTMYINFVYEVGNTIYYSDMIKVKVASDTGEIVGFEAQDYLINHTDRGAVSSPTITEQDVRANVPSGMKLEAITLAVIPDGENEILSYELYGQYEGTDYFIYIDATTGYEVNILQVIDGDQGRLLI